MNHLPWLLSAVTIATMWLAGSRWRHVWLLGLANQVLWLTWILLTSNWGFLPMNIAMVVVCVRNHRKWNTVAPFPASWQKRRTGPFVNWEKLTPRQIEDMADKEIALHEKLQRQRATQIFYGPGPRVPKP